MNMDLRAEDHLETELNQYVILMPWLYLMNDLLRMMAILIEPNGPIAISGAKHARQNFPSLFCHNLRALYDFIKALTPTGDIQHNECARGSV